MLKATSIKRKVGIVLGLEHLAFFARSSGAFDVHGFDAKLSRFRDLDRLYHFDGNCRSVLAWLG